MELLLEVFKNKLVSVAEEMGLVLQRTAFSPNIKERKDLSCAVFTREGDLVAQADHIPVHLGSMGSAVREAIGRVRMEEGDMVVLNSPFMGGTHLPDITLVAPVFYKGELIFYVACRAHHADVGGMSSGSMPLSREIFQEGLVIPPVKLVEGGKIREDILSFILSNVRTPEERMGDLKAQMMANSVGIKRILEITEELGPRDMLRLSAELLDYSERLMRRAIDRIPDGLYTFEDFMEDDGFGREDIAIRVEVRIEGDGAVVDLTRSDPQTQGTVNAVRSVTLASVYYVFRCLLPEDAPTNDGCFRPIRVITKRGTVVDAEFPSPVAGGNVETSQRIVDVVLGALSKALPHLIPAASQGTMNNLAIGGKDPETGRVFTYYETIGGGMGAWRGGDGESAVHSHMTNTMNTPVEALEHAYPLLVREYSVRRGSGGRGRWRGGDGIVREIEVLCPAEVTVLSERRRRRPYGLFGGEPGKEGRNIVIRNGKEETVGGKFTTRLMPGDRVRIETPGGGGYA
jgi:N-methylhydantoinase B